MKKYLRYQFIRSVYRVMIIRNSFIVLFLALLEGTLLIRCTDYAQTPDYFKGCAVYTTEHFRIHFRECDYSLQEVKRFGEKKERLLRYINTALAVEFNTVIDTYLFISGSNPFATLTKKTFESCSYIHSDCGHEIVHVVTFETLGYSCSRFLIEGFAEAIELDFDHSNAIVRFVAHAKAVGKDKDLPIAEKISNNSSFIVCPYDYDMAGGFVKYLMCRWNIETVKEFYQASATCTPSALAQTFHDIFGISLQQAVADFEKKYF